MKKKVTINYMVCKDKHSGVCLGCIKQCDVGEYHKEQYTIEFTPKMEKMVKDYRRQLLKGAGIFVCTETLMLSMAALFGRAAGTREDGKSNLCNYPVALGAYAVSSAFMAQMIENALCRSYDVDPHMPLKNVKKIVAHAKACEMILQKYKDHTVIFLDK